MIDRRDYTKTRRATRRARNLQDRCEPLPGRDPRRTDTRPTHDRTF